MVCSHVFSVPIHIIYSNYHISIFFRPPQAAGTPIVPKQRGQLEGGSVEVIIILSPDLSFAAENPNCISAVH